MTLLCPECGTPAILTYTHYLAGQRAGDEEFGLHCPSAQHDLAQARLRALWDAACPTGRVEAVGRGVHGTG